MLLETSVVCLALAMYHEARGEGVIGELAVGTVVINRSMSGDRRWPKTICGVVKQGGTLPLNGCQFSFYCDGRSDTPYDRVAWDNSMWNARWLLSGRVSYPRLREATCYHAKEKRPHWAKGLLGFETEGHIFYGC